MYVARNFRYKFSTKFKSSGEQQMRALSPRLCSIAIAVATLFVLGCAGPVYTVYDPNYLPGFSGAGLPGGDLKNDGFPIDRIGICGPMSDRLADAFIYAGYLAADLGPDDAACPDKAQARNIKFIAVCELAPDPDATPGLADDYNMLVLDMHTGDPIWRVIGEQTPTGLRVRRNGTLEVAFHDMVAAFSTIYPPAAKRHPAND